MDQSKMGVLIRSLRLKHGMTQLALAQRLHISDKTVSKWERGCGAPDVSLLPALAQALQVDLEALMKGECPENERSNGNLKTEWNLETRLPMYRYATLLWYCTQHGLFYQRLL